MKPKRSDGIPKMPLRALVFEDHREDIEICLYTLRAAGFDVTADVVATLEEFGKQMRSESYDVILSDYRMPSATGMDAFEVMKAQGEQIPFILVTGSLGDEKAVECLKEGVSDYVLKDRLIRLPSAIERALEEKRLRQERARAEEALRNSDEQLRLRNQELEEQNHRAEAASRLKTAFLANMSHELRSPLNGIIGFSELIHDGRMGPLTESQQECMGRILNSARHLLRLINDVLDMAKIEAGKLTFRPEAVSISRLVAEACDSLATLAAEKRIRVEYQIDPAMEAVVDPARFKQILYNYLSNALKFSQEEGHVTVKVTPQGSEEFLIEVTDDGLGISAEDLAELFTDFHQLDSGKGKRFPGTGLGLALTRRVVEAQGGRVGVRSVLGKGSTFFAVLPRAAQGI
jgi:signal transduction histidine kinase